MLLSIDATSNSTDIISIMIKDYIIAIRSINAKILLLMIKYKMLFIIYYRKLEKVVKRIHPKQLLAGYLLK